MGMVTLVDAGKVTDKIKHQFMIKHPNTVGMGVSLKLKRPIANCILSSRRLTVSSKIGTKVRSWFLHFLLYIVLELLVSTINQEMWIKGTHIEEKEEKLELVISVVTRYS